MTSNSNFNTVTKKLSSNTNPIKEKYSTQSQKSLNTGNISNILKMNQNQPSIKNKFPDKVLREREDGFSVYIMGANEERIKNMRKKEQLEKNKTRGYTSNSVMARKKWEPIIPINKIIEKTQSVEREMSQFGNRPDSINNISKVKSPGVDYKIVSKMIIGNSNFSNKIMKNQDSIGEDFIHNLNQMKRKVFDLESPHHNINNNSKRRRNWGEPQYNIVYPEYSSSVEHSNERHKIKTLATDASLMRIDNIFPISYQSTITNKHFSMKHSNHIEELEKSEEEINYNNSNLHNVVNQLETINSKEESDHNNNLSNYKNRLKNSNSTLILTKEFNTSKEKLHFKENYTNNINSNKIKNLSMNSTEGNILNISNNFETSHNEKINPIQINIKKINSAHPKNRTKSTNKKNPKLIERPLSHIMNMPKLNNIKINNELLHNASQKSIKNNNDGILNKLNPLTIMSNTGNKTNLNSIPSIQFIYKSPQNKLKSNRPLSHIQKGKSIVSKNSLNLNNYNQKEVTQNNLNLNLSNLPKNIINDRFSSREMTKDFNDTIMNYNTTKKKKSSPSYPIISNIQSNANVNMNNKIPNLNLNNLNKNINHNNLINSHSKKRIEIFSKIDRLDDRKLNKLARVVEELANSAEQSDLSLLDSINLKHSNRNVQNLIFSQIKDKFNINYIKADSVNFGNININVNNSSHNGINKNVNLNHNLIKLPLSTKKTFDEEFDEEMSPTFNKNNNKFNVFSNSVTINPFKRSLKKSTSFNPILNFSVISITIISNWGNPDKLGLTEIQIFDKDYKNIEIIECHVFNANEENINKIFNNKFHTIDENEMWTSFINFNNLNTIKIEIYYEAITTDNEVEEIVIWNYNAKDLTKGIKEIEISKKNQSVWKGIINKGSHNIKSDYSTRISLVNNDEIKYNFELTNLMLNSVDLESKEMSINYNSPKNEKNIISMNDSKMIKEDLETEDILKHSQNSIRNRITINRKDKEKENIFNIRNSDNLNNTSTQFLNSARNSLSNYNSNSSNLNNNHFNHTNNNHFHNNLNENYENNILRTSIGKTAGSNFNNILNKLKGVSCKRIKLIISSNYGDSNFVGLTGLQFLDENEEIINVEKAKTIGAMPKDVNSVYNNGDSRIFENIFNNQNEIIDDYNMWLTTFNHNPHPFIELSFDKTITISQIKFWNYNKPNKLNRGIKTIEIILDENYNNQERIILRKGLGEVGIDFSQIVKLPNLNLIQFTEEELKMFTQIKPASLNFQQDFETPYLPSGFIFKLSLISTHGDNKFIGLDKIEFFDYLGKSVFKNYNFKIFANSRNNIEIPFEENINLVTNLIDKEENSWITNFYNHKIVVENNLNNTFSRDNNESNIKPNIIYFIFDKPVSLSYIQIWNYSKNENIGVNEISFTCDDNIIYKGCLSKYNKSSNFSKYDNSNVILFTSDYNLTKNINENLLTNSEVKNKYKIEEKDDDTIHIMQLDN